MSCGVMWLLRFCVGNWVRLCIVWLLLVMLLRLCCMSSSFIVWLISICLWVWLIGCIFVVNLISVWVVSG